MPQISTNLNVPISTIIKVVAVLVGLWALYLIADIILLMIASLLLAAAIDPYVDKLQARGIPRSISMLGIYLILFSILSLVLVLILPPVLRQINALAYNFPELYRQFLGWTGSLSPSGATSGGSLSLPSAISTATQGVYSLVANVFGGIVSFLTVVVLTFYLVIDEGAIKRLLAVAPARHQKYLNDLYERVQAQVGVWFRAQLILMVLIGCLTYVLLTALNLFGYHMPYALTLALIAGLTEFIPYVGPIIGAVPALFIAYNVSPGMMIAVGLIYYAIQTLENNFFVPKIMERALGISPIISIVAFLIGAQLAGIIGAFLSIPIATVVIIITTDIMNRRRNTVGL
jgi:predicted PurR-regulated permease PerM